MVRNAGTAWGGGAYAPGVGVNYDSASSGSAVKGTNENWTATWHDIDITPLVRAWAGGRQNYGLAIQTYSAIGAAISQPKRTDFATRESGNAPQLVVTYSTSGGTNAPPRITAVPECGREAFGATCSAKTGKRYRMEWTANLLLTNWHSLTTLTAEADSIPIRDPGITSVTSRFYRVVNVP